ncbi:MAG TPA: hypothetical protein PKN02_09635 [Thermotogota bacterium]|nr:hypothetical protein [Thermotogota bacterium]
MPPFLKTHLNRAYDHLDSIIYIMNEVCKGKNAKEIKKRLVEDDPFSTSSREYRSLVAHWLVADFVTGFSPKALQVFARLMVSDALSSQLKREVLFWKTCERDAVARELTLSAIYTAYHAGVPSIPEAVLYDVVREKAGLAETTVKRCVGGFLAIAANVGFLSRADATVKLNFFRPKLNAVAAILYFLFDSELPPAQIPRAPDFKFLLLDEAAVLSSLSDLRSAGMISFASAGNVVRLEPKIPFEVLPDVFAE